VNPKCKWRFRPAVLLHHRSAFGSVCDAPAITIFCCGDNLSVHPARRRWTVRIEASISPHPSRPYGRRYAQVAQLVEHVTENHGVGGSIPPLGTNEIKD
jgi:hypothetical protein